jgi:hypothetical protein
MKIKENILPFTLSDLEAVKKGFFVNFKYVDTYEHIYLRGDNLSFCHKNSELILTFSTGVLPSYVFGGRIDLGCHQTKSKDIAQYQINLP